ncbi:hypothetical protein COO60DRAFT_1634146 [Scenedesmus sp. NREL 46B-D3]|nr:hypothetical protein COO60DRAFT_1634146 [Scenedesmus sp. NREL 46B-D3]
MLFSPLPSSCQYTAAAAAAAAAGRGAETIAGLPAGLQLLGLPAAGAAFGGYHSRSSSKRKPSTDAAAASSSSSSSQAAPMWDLAWCAMFRYSMREFLAAELMAMEAHQDAAASDFLQQQGWADDGADDAVPRGGSKDQYGLPARSCLTAEQGASGQCAAAGCSADNKLTGNKVVIVTACAGAGKTTLMKKLMTQALLGDSNSLVLYTAFNQHVVKGPDGASTWFCNLPHDKSKRIACRTAHQLASEKMRLIEERGWKLKDFGYQGYRSLWRALRDTRYFGARLQADPAHGGPSLQHACDVADKHLRLAARKGQGKFPRVASAGEGCAPYVEIAQQMWDIIQSGQGYTGDQPLAVPHNAYFKMFAMEVVATGRQLAHFIRGKPWGFIVVDEAQDYNECMQQLIMSQHCTKVFVGDSYQHIYTFNNCGDALKEAAAIAAAMGIPVQHFRINRSFRLAAPVTCVANRLCFLMGERRAAVAPGSRAACAVYAAAQLLPAAAGQQASAAAAAPEAAAGGAAGAAGTGAAAAAGGGSNAGAQPAAAFQRLELPGTATDHESLPLRVEATRLPCGLDPAVQGAAHADNRGLTHLVVPPVDPATGCRPTVCVLVRYNRTWFEALSGLVAATLGVEEPPAAAASPAAAAAAGSPAAAAATAGPPAAAAAAGGGGGGTAAAAAAVPTQSQPSSSQLSADSPDVPHASSGSAGAAPAAAPVAAAQGGRMPRVFLSAEPGQDGDCRGFLTRLEHMCLLKSGKLREHLAAAKAANGKKAYSEVYHRSWEELAGAADRGVLEPELQGAFDTLQRLGLQRTQQTVAAIRTSKAKGKLEADYIFSTTHKYKGGEEGWVQLADDFRPIAGGMEPGVEWDEYCLLFVAASRAQQALILNQDLQQLMTHDLGQRPQLLLQVGQRSSRRAAAAGCDTQQRHPCSNSSQLSSSSSDGVDGATAQPGQLLLLLLHHMQPLTAAALAAEAAAAACKAAAAAASVAAAAAAAAEAGRRREQQAAAAARVLKYAQHAAAVARAPSVWQAVPAAAAAAGGVMAAQQAQDGDEEDRGWCDAVYALEKASGLALA